MMYRETKILIVINAIAALLCAWLVFAQLGWAWPTASGFAGVTPVPAAETVCEEYLNFNGLYAVLYDSDGDGVPDYMTLTRTDNTQAPAGQPLFYVLDINHSGEWDAVWVDREEDGINNNEKLYWVK